ncbi:MAG: bacitracin ABC transporter permease [Bacteroidetes bacterium HGW-Bacteroidetes-6]|jgi:ABC-2 type transport system permease protein|nr:MAG: bacitracin ABC transporter permease [Bacteroidetes bacterium HGW-Bacteroidetes-6]
MKSLLTTFCVEYLKTRKSKIFWATILFFMFVSSMMGLLMFVQIHPEISGKLGMIGNKASMLRFGEPNWENYLTLLMQGIAGVGLVGIGFVASWVFGREFSEHTAKDILALPVSRTYIVFSKFIIVVIWSVILSLIYFVTGLLIGLLIGLPDWSGSIAFQYAFKYFVTSLLILLLSTPVAFLASYSRGYMFPLGFVILTLILANFVGMVGLGPYFPWAIPGLYGMTNGTEDLQLNGVSYIILILACLLGFFGTLFYWRFADQK